LTLDLDSLVTPVFGGQQRAAVGYNPKKKGRNSYPTLLCFIGETRDYPGGLFRSGDAGNSTPEFSPFSIVIHSVLNNCA
jgi:hypothetical protein